VANPQKSRTLIAALIRRARPAHAHVEEAAADVLAIIRGMIDAAGERGEGDIEAQALKKKLIEDTSENRLQPGSWQT
jgi:hypothetical protein